MLLRVGIEPEWPTLGHDVIDFVEAYCCHGPGDVQGEAFELDDEEAQLFLDLYRVYPKGHEREGRRLVARALYSRAKGRRKSELAGALVVAEARGPVRFAGWNAAGDPVGRPVRAPFIRCLATEESQSGNTYGNVVVMLEHAAKHAPELFGDVDVGQRAQGSTRIFLRRDSGEIRPSTASSAAKDGGKETFAVEDEPHLYVTPELHRMDDVIRRNLTKRKAAEPWLLRTSTAHRPGENSVAEGDHDHAKAISEGRAKAAGLYVNHVEGPAVADWDDDEEALAALAVAYGPAAEWMDLRRMLEDEIRNPQAELADSERYFLNRTATRAAVAFDLARWRELKRDRVELGDRPFVVLSFDGARFHDSTALLATSIELGFQWLLGLWEKPFDAGPDWEVDESEVDAAVESAFDELDVWRLYADPPYWNENVTSWIGRFGEKRVVKWWTNRFRPMAYAVRSFETAIRAGDVLCHDGDERLDRHIGNARKSETHVRDEKGQRMSIIRKEFPDSPNKIDAAMTAVLGWEARSDAVAAGARPRRRTNRALVV